MDHTRAREALDLLAELERAGFVFGHAAGRAVISPASRLSAEQRAALALHREALLELLAGLPTPAQQAAALAAVARRWSPFDCTPDAELFAALAAHEQAIRARADRKAHRHKGCDAGGRNKLGSRSPPKGENGEPKPQGTLFAGEEKKS